MSFLGLMLRTGLRQRWRSWLALIVLVTLVVGLVLAGAQTARRTSTAWSRFEAAHGFDTFAYSPSPIHHVAALPGVVSAVQIASPAVGPPTCDSCASQINDSDFSVQEVSPAQLTHLTKLESGRLPDQSDPGQVLASESLAPLGVHIGTVIHVPLASSTQRAAVMNNVNMTPAGPTVALRVVGMEAAEFEFPSNATPAYDLYATTAFAKKYDPGAVIFNEYVFRLRHGTRDILRFDAALNKTGLGGSEDLSSLSSSIATSIDPQVVGWWILTGLAALVGVIVLAQALARQDAIDAEDYPALRALGATRRQLFTFTMVRTVLLAFVGVVGAVLPRSRPVGLHPGGRGPAGRSQSGLRFRRPAPRRRSGAGVGGPGRPRDLARDTGVRARHSDDGTVVRPSRIVAAVSASGAPPSALIGIRNALERGRGRSAVPVSSALVGSVLAVAALCGTVVFGSSLSHLTATPAEYGQGFDAWFSANTTGTEAQNEQLLTAVERPGIDAILAGVSGAGHRRRPADRRPRRADRPGPLRHDGHDGKPPAAPNQVLLGSKTMQQLGVHIGSTVRVNFASSAGSPGPEPTLHRGRHDRAAAGLQPPRRPWHRRDLLVGGIHRTRLPPWPAGRRLPRVVCGRQQRCLPRARRTRTGGQGGDRRPEPRLPRAGEPAAAADQPRQLRRGRELPPDRRSRRGALRSRDPACISSLPASADGVARRAC